MDAEGLKRLNTDGIPPSGNDFEEYETYARPHAGPGSSHMITIGYNDIDLSFDEKGIADVPSPTCAADSGTVVEHRQSLHRHMAQVMTIAFTPTLFHFETDPIW